jgi:hypothetical protein
MLTLSRETRSAACSNVSPEISSTSLLSFPSPGPGRGPLDEAWAWVSVAVARHLRANRAGECERSEEDVEGTFAESRARGRWDVENALLQHDACLPQGLVRRLITLCWYLMTITITPGDRDGSSANERVEER